MRLFPLLIIGIMLSACNLPAKNSSGLVTPTDPAVETPTRTPSQTPTASPTMTRTATSIPTATTIPSQTPSPTPSATPIASQTPTPSPLATITLTTTLEGASVTADQNVNCRWGPGTVFLHAGLFAEGETAHVDGRNYAKTWLWIQQANTGAHCWVAASAVDILGDLESVPVVPTDPPANPQVPSPQNVNAVRSNNKVTITWNPAPPALDLHYLVKAKVCNGQFIIEVLDTTLNTAYTLQDQQTCSGTSSAKIFTVNKLGYSQPVKVPWP